VRENKNTWRGMRLDPTWADYTSFTTKHSVITVKNYVSTSKDRGEGERFAIKKSNDGRKGLLLECVLKDGRDISMLSEHGKEKEVLLLPGAQLKVEKATKAHPSLPYDWLVKVKEQ
jgi:ADP-ribosyltransferase exoenzyme